MKSGGKAPRDSGNDGEHDEEEGNEVDDEVLKALQGIRDDNKSLRANVDRLESQINAGREKEQEPEEPEPVEVSLDPQEYATVDEYSEAMEDPSKFNQILSKVAQQAANKAVEHALLSVPKIVRREAQSQISDKGVVDQFWQSNPDLVKHTDFVGYMASEEYSKNPEKSTQEILDAILPKIRENLSLEGPKSDVKESDNGKPRILPGSKGRRRRTSVAKPKGIEAQINEMRRL